MAKTLMLMRHAKSSWKDKSLADFKRPLKKRGAEAAKYIGGVLERSHFTPHLILSSPAKRAKQTAEIVAETSGYEGEIEFVESFYMGEPSAFYERLKQLPSGMDKVLIVAHNPGLEMLVQMMDSHVVALPTGSLAMLKLDIEDWAYLEHSSAGEMIAFWDPEPEDGHHKHG